MVVVPSCLKEVVVAEEVAVVVVDRKQGKVSGRRCRWCGRRSHGSSLSPRTPAPIARQRSGRRPGAGEIERCDPSGRRERKRGREA